MVVKDNSDRHAKLLKVARAHDLSEYSINGSGWKAFMFLRGALKPAEVKSKWLNFKDNNPSLWEKPDMWKESTYEECVEWKFDPESLVLTVTMYDRDGFDHGFGRTLRGNPRCQWEIQVGLYDNEIFKSLLTPRIMGLLANKAEAIYDEQLEDQRNKAIDLILKRMFE